jgi:hypothetical protein
VTQQVDEENIHLRLCHCRYSLTGWESIIQYNDEDLINLILEIAAGKADDRVLHAWVLAHIDPQAE